MAAGRLRRLASVPGFLHPLGADLVHVAYCHMPYFIRMLGSSVVFLLSRPLFSHEFSVVTPDLLTSRILRQVYMGHSQYVSAAANLSRGTICFCPSGSPLGTLRPANSLTKP